MLKKKLGQFFTTNNKVQLIFKKLIENKIGTILEPSVGNGDLLSQINLDNRKSIIVEYDNNLFDKIKEQIKNHNITLKKGCFFEQSLKNISSIVANPPYVSKNEYVSYMSEAMKNFVDQNQYKGKYNISYLFIHRCAELLNDNGEMIFIVPKDFSYSTSALPLRRYLQNYGYFTHWIDCQEEKIFTDASIETLVIFRWIKTKHKKSTKFYKNISSFFSNNCKNKKEIYMGKQETLFFVKNKDYELFKKFGSISQYFNVMVGSVTGCDPVFKVDNQKIDYNKNKKALQYFNTGFNQVSLFINSNNFNKFSDLPEDIQKYLLKNKRILLKRYGIKKNNWWKWSFLRNAEYSLSENNQPKILTFSKTRAKTPFVIGNNYGFVGSVYALFPKNNQIDLNNVIEILNSPFYKELYLSSGLAVNNKFQSTPNALKDIPFPHIDEINKYMKILKSK